MDDLRNILLLQRFEDGGVVLVELLALLLLATLQAEFLDFIGDTEGCDVRVGGRAQTSR